MNPYIVRRRTVERQCIDKVKLSCGIFTTMPAVFDQYLMSTKPAPDLEIGVVSRKRVCFFVPASDRVVE